MDVHVDLRQRCADNVGVGFFQELECMQGHLARRAAPAHAEESRIGQTRDVTQVDVSVHVRSGYSDAEAYHPRYGAYFRE